MRLFIILIYSISLIQFVQCQSPWDKEKIEVKKNQENNTIISAKSIFSEGWSELPQTIFWKKIMKLSEDSVLINIASSRTIIKKIKKTEWNNQPEGKKEDFKDSIREIYGLDKNEKIYCTSGKKNFYRFDIIYPYISRGIESFEKFNVDPWYSQSILLIESPGQLTKSKSGAYGVFQLMPKVARDQGLTVNQDIDERSDFERSAYAASQLLKKTCIPQAKKILDSKKIKYKEDDIWFRLFVLHIYHAGAKNVAAVFNKIDPKKGGQYLIQEMWQNTAANFKNNSQNYTQVALAAQIILDEYIHSNYDYILDCVSMDNN
tara:strand:- start:4368 stop:5321 length:954 start_codon:yes stop_codon:yes gene_type:complete